ncbi:MAG: hypothetical protein ACREOF_08930 [Gemmatimonadales bacterium]
MPPQLQPLVAAVRQHYARGANLTPDGTLQVGPMPWVGPEGFALVLYAPPGPGWLAGFAARAGRAVPEPYGAVLAALNGCFAFGLALYGLPPSLHQRPVRPDRRVLEPLDLDAANRYWAQRYRAAEGAFHFGGRTWTATENLGYFITPGGGFQSRRDGGELVREWSSLRDLLAEELAAAEERDRESRPSARWPLR